MALLVCALVMQWISLGGLIYVVHRHAHQLKRQSVLHHQCSASILAMAESVGALSQYVVLQGARLDAHAVLLRERTAVSPPLTLH